MSRKLIFIMLPLVLMLVPCRQCRGSDFLLLGDPREASGNKNHELAGKIIQDATGYLLDSGQAIDGIILTGDFVAHAGDAVGWDTLREAYRPAFAYPLYPCLGNHDDEKPSLGYKRWNYSRTFNKPRWYSTDIAEGVHLVSLDSNLTWTVARSHAA